MAEGADSSAPRSGLVARVAAVMEVGDNPPVFVAALAEHEDGSGFGMEFQLASVFDEQDRRLGMDTFCIRTSEGPTHYGGVEALQIGPDRVDIDFDEAAAEVLQVPRQVRIHLAVDIATADAFIVALCRILGRS